MAFFITAVSNYFRNRIPAVTKITAGILLLSDNERTEADTADEQGSPSRYRYSEAPVEAKRPLIAA